MQVQQAVVPVLSEQQYSREERAAPEPIAAMVAVAVAVPVMQQSEVMVREALPVVEVLLAEVQEVPGQLEMVMELPVLRLVVQVAQQKQVPQVDQDRVVREETEK
jgi:hypothetical protein